MVRFGDKPLARGLIGEERRSARRVPPERTPWRRAAVLRPGQDVVLLNVSAGGALLHSAGRIAPGARTELQLSGAQRLAVRGRIARCRVIALAPLRYEAAIVFDEPLRWESADGRTAACSAATPS